jgi:hypothetical protein
VRDPRYGGTRSKTHNLGYVQAHEGLSTGASLRFSECPDWVGWGRIIPTVGRSIVDLLYWRTKRHPHTMEPRSRHRGALVSTGGEI